MRRTGAQGRMMRRMMRTAVYVIALTVFLATTSAVFAGGFAIREQSVKGQGASFAGVAAGSGGLSSLFWNPAVSSDYTEFGFISETNSALIAPYSKSEQGSGNIGKLAIVPASYMSFGLTDDVTLAASLNAPLGLTTDGNDGWAGSPLGDKSVMKTYTFNPSVSYKLNDMFSIGVGAQIEYMSVKLNAKAAGSGASLYGLDGHDVGFGLTAGVLFEPTDTTDIGIGFRSSVSHTLKGDAVIGLANPAITAQFKSPEIVTLGIRQQLSDQLAVMGGVEWTNWSRFQSLDVKSSGATLMGVPQNWKDSWLISAGAEYTYTDTLTLRSGVAYEKSPVPDATRSVRVPDNDRYWLSLGATYKLSDSFAANLAYSHVFIEDGDVRALNTTFKQHLDIVSVGLTHDW